MGRQHCGCDATATIRLLWRHLGCYDVTAVAAAVATMRWRQQCGCCGGKAAGVVMTGQQHCGCCSNNAVAAVMQLLWQQRGCFVDEETAALRLLWQ